MTHTITTTSIATSLARLLHMDDKQVHNIHYGALLHDLGKIGIPVEILEFPGKLSPQAMINTQLVDTLKLNFNKILKDLNEKCVPILDTYYGMKAEYETLLEKYHSQHIYLPA